MIDAEKQRREHEEEEEERKVTEALKPSSRIIKMVAKMKVLKDRAGQNTDHGDELVPANKMQPRITSGYEEWSAQVACCAAARVEQASAEGESHDCTSSMFECTVHTICLCL